LYDITQNRFMAEGLQRLTHYSGGHALCDDDF